MRRQDVALTLAEEVRILRLVAVLLGELLGVEEDASDGVGARTRVPVWIRLGLSLDLVGTSEFSWKIRFCKFGRKMWFFKFSGKIGFLKCSWIKWF